MKIANRKICLNNKLTSRIQIIDLYVYNNLRVSTLQNLIKQIRRSELSKDFMYIYSYKYKNKHGWCGVITSEAYTKEEYEVYVDKLKQKYNKLTVFTLNGELLV